MTSRGYHQFTEEMGYDPEDAQAATLYFARKRNRMRSMIPPEIEFILPTPPTPPKISPVEWFEAMTLPPPPRPPIVMVICREFHRTSVPQVGIVFALPYVPPKHCLGIPNIARR